VHLILRKTRRLGGVGVWGLCGPFGLWYLGFGLWALGF